MSRNFAFVTTLNAKKRQVEWNELNRLKKDILLAFVENTNQLNAAWLPSPEDFALPYWEYATLAEDAFMHEEDRVFYRQGSLIVILCMSVEYLDTASGYGQIFGNNKISDIRTCVDLFQPRNEDEKMLKKIVGQGLDMAVSMSPHDRLDSGFEHPDSDAFYPALSWVDKTFIKPYFANLAVDRIIRF